jgi:DNA-binding response OmpR family regulator
VTDNAHILVVDDDADICELVEAALTREGYKVTTANNTSEMRQVMARTPINLVVLDIMLPDGNGLDEMRRLSAQSDICVIILSGKGEPVERILGLESGADDYLAKPFHVHELIARSGSILRRNRPICTSMLRSNGSAVRLCRNSMI